MNPRAGISLARDTCLNTTRAPSAGSEKEGEFGFETRSHVSKSGLELLPPLSSGIRGVHHHAQFYEGLKTESFKHTSKRSTE